MVQVEPSPFGLSLKRYRIAAGLTQEELAERAGLSAHAISDLERGARRSPYRDTIRLLADALQLSEEERRTLETAARRVREPASPPSPPPPQPTRPWTNLPTPPTSFIGREQEVAGICDLLEHRNTHLLTLTGPGGTGKTRLAIEVGTTLLPHFPHGVFFVSLAPISDPELVVSAIATSLGLSELPGQPLLRTIEVHLHDKQILLILDNFEHLLEAAPIVTQLRTGTAQLRILVTSRAPLHLYGEQEFPVPPLAVPDSAHLPPVEIVSQSEAIRLFVERARAVRPSFAVTDENIGAVSEICRRLDGLPLSIELAAARIKLFSPQALLARLSSRLTLLTGGPRDLPSRQQSLRATIDWSYSLLTEEEQMLFARLSVFAGGCTLEAAEAVCNADGDLGIGILDGIAALVDKGLLQQKGEEEPRFLMLETIREYATEHLESSGDGDRIHQHYAEYFRCFADTAEPGLRTAEQGTWLDRLSREHDNLRAVLRWSLDRHEAEMAQAFVGALWLFWRIRCHYTEGRAWLEAALVYGGEPHSRLKVLQGADVLARMQGDFERATPLAEESLALARELGDTWGMAFALNTLGGSAAAHGDYARFRALMEESLSLCRQQENQWFTTTVLNNFGAGLRWEGDYRKARQVAEESLIRSRQLGIKGSEAAATYILATVALDEGNHDEAGVLARHALGLFYEIRNIWEVVTALECLAGLAVVRRQPDRAVRLWAAAAILLAEIGISLDPHEQREHDHYVAAARCQSDEAAWTAAWQEGSAMTLDEAVRYALDESHDA